MNKEDEVVIKGSFVLVTHKDKVNKVNKDIIRMPTELIFEEKSIGIITLLEKSDNEDKTL